jgi:hypothetical protein
MEDGNDKGSSAMMGAMGGMQQGFGGPPGFGAGIQGMNPAFAGMAGMGVPPGTGMFGAGGTGGGFGGGARKPKATGTCRCPETASVPELLLMLNKIAIELQVRLNPGPNPYAVPGAPAAQPWMANQPPAARGPGMGGTHGAPTNDQAAQSAYSQAQREYAAAMAALQGAEAPGDAARPAWAKPNPATMPRQGATFDQQQSNQQQRQEQQQETEVAWMKAQQEKMQRAFQDGDRSFMARAQDQAAREAAAAATERTEPAKQSSRTQKRRGARAVPASATQAEDELTAAIEAKLKAALDRAGDAHLLAKAAAESEGVEAGAGAGAGEGIDSLVDALLASMGQGGSDGSGLNLEELLGGGQGGGGGEQASQELQAALQALTRDALAEHLPASQQDSALPVEESLPGADDGENVATGAHGHGGEL